MSILIALLTTIAAACEGGDALVRTLPADGAVDVPTNARAVLVFESEFRASGDTVLPFLVPVDGGEPVLVTRYGWSALDADSMRRRFVELLPAEPLAAETTYGLHVTSWDVATSGTWGEPLSTFTTGQGTSPPLLDPPAVTLSSTYEREGAGDCEAGLVRDHHLSLAPPVDDPSGLGIFHVVAVDANGSGGLVPPDYSIPIDAIAEQPEIVVTVAAEADTPSCVVAVWQGPDGTWSQPSAPVCDDFGLPEDTGAPPALPPELGRTTGGGGCSTAPVGVPFWLAAFGLVGLRRRR